MNETDENGEKEKPGEYKKFVAESLQIPRKGIHERLIAHALIRANNTSDRLEKISTICEAAMGCKNRDKLDMELVGVCHSVSLSLMNTELNPKQGMAHISWNFPSTEENWKKYVEPWQRKQLWFFAVKTSYCHENYPSKPIFSSFVDDEKVWENWEEVRKKVHKELSEMPKWKGFFEMSSALSRNSFFILKGEFEGWALNRLLEVQSKIAEEVDPSVYMEMLDMMLRSRGRQNEGSVA